MTDPPFDHWSAHLRAFFGWYSEPPDYHVSETELPTLRDMIASGLRNEGFGTFAESLAAAATETDLNNEIIRQYTAESPLYSSVNKLLRSAHAGASLVDHPMTAWMLQFNCAIRLQPVYEGTSYRGAEMSNEDIACYKPGTMFVWGPFVSTSKSRRVAEAYSAGVLFEITPWGSYSMYDKRNPYDISGLSDFPDEEEVVFPTSCTYRVTDATERNGIVHIAIQTVDQY